MKGKKKAPGRLNNKTNGNGKSNGNGTKSNQPVSLPNKLKSVDKREQMQDTARGGYEEIEIIEKPSTTTQ